MKTFIASPRVIQGYPINSVVFIEGLWLLLNKMDDISSDKINLVDFELYDEELVYERIPKLKGNLNESEETFVDINEKTGELHFNPKHKHMGFSTANDARATNQANVEISILSYVLNRKKYIKKLSWNILLIIILSYSFSWIILFYLARILFLHIFTILNDRNMCLSGTLNPAIVMETHPTKIAVLTNLSMWRGNYPVIRIKRVELPRSFNIIGKRIPVAGKYQNVKEQSFWDYYDPIPLPLGINNKDVIDKKINEISVYDWVELTKQIGIMGSNIKEGYYPINVEKNSWKEIEEPKFTQFNEEK